MIWIRFIVIVFLVYTPLNLVAKSYSVYYKQATAKKFGDYSYKNKISKKQTKGIPHFLVTYERRRIVLEKHYTSNKLLSYFAKYRYQKNGAFSKIEILFSKQLLRVKIKNPSLKIMKRGVYNKIKYLHFINKKKKLFKVEEYHGNGKVNIATFYNDKEQIEQKDVFDKKGKKINRLYYNYLKKKRILWKEEKLEEKSGKKGYWTIYYNDNGKVKEKTFSPTGN